MTLLSSVLDRWNLTLDDPPLETRTGIVANVREKEQPYILKIAPEGGDERTALALNHYKGHGAVHVIKVEKNATLLERALPGTPLSTLVTRGEDDRATEILCEIIQKLHTPNKIVGEFPSLQDLEESFESYLHSQDPHLPHALVKEAHTVYKDLVASQPSSVLLHGDLHHDNVLNDENRGWLAIDPKGYIGDPTFEVGTLLRNPRSYPELYQNPERIHRRVAILCERLGFERERVLAWAFSQAVLAAILSIEDKESPMWALEAALHLKKAFLYTPKAIRTSHE